MRCIETFAYVPRGGIIGQARCFKKGEWKRIFRNGTADVRHIMLTVMRKRLQTESRLRIASPVNRKNAYKYGAIYSVS